MAGRGFHPDAAEGHAQDSYPARCLMSSWLKAPEKIIFGDKTAAVVPDWN